jgi:hypothetical protein
MNGFLSASDDQSGYAAGAPTAIGSAATASLVSDQHYRVHPRFDPRRVRGRVVRSRTIDPVLLVRRALDTPVSWRAVWQWERRSIAAAGELRAALHVGQFAGAAGL